MNEIESFGCGCMVILCVCLLTVLPHIEMQCTMSVDSIPQKCHCAPFAIHSFIHSFVNQQQQQQNSRNSMAYCSVAFVQPTHEPYNIIIIIIIVIRMIHFYQWYFFCQRVYYMQPVKRNCSQLLFFCWFHHYAYYYNNPFWHECNALMGKLSFNSDKRTKEQKKREICEIENEKEKTLKNSTRIKTESGNYDAYYYCCLLSFNGRCHAMALSNFVENDENKYII